MMASTPGNITKVFKMVSCDPENIIEVLKLNNYFLMTNEEGMEMYDDDGNLLVFKSDSGDCISVPNIEAVRNLYDLPLNTPEIKDVIKKEAVLNNSNLLFIPNSRNNGNTKPGNTNCMVWIGQRSEHSMRATENLIRLFDSPKYQRLMNDRSTIKLKVWEKIACELQDKGFKIANTSRDAGLRTFQKWRNMERTYLKFLRMKPEDCGEDKRRKKPYFFDAMHSAMLKRVKHSEPVHAECIMSYNAENGNTSMSNTMGVGEETENKPADDFISAKRPDVVKESNEAFPRQALSLLTALVTSQKYDKFLKENKFVNKMRVWESIYVDMERAGWKFANTKREGAVILSEKWRIVEKSILKKRLSGPRTLYTPTLRKALLMDIVKRRNLGRSQSCEALYQEESSSRFRRLKGGEIEPEAIEALLKVIDSDHYRELFTSGGSKRTRIWEQIYEEIQAMGFVIAGETKREKVSRLFQKWRNMKRSFVKYQVAKFRGRETKKPMHYDMLFKIISKDVLKMDDPTSFAEALKISDPYLFAEEVKMNDPTSFENEESDTIDPLEYLDPFTSQADHDYSTPNVSGNSTAAVTSPILLPNQTNSTHQASTPVYYTNETLKNAVQSNTSSVNSHPSTSRTSRSSEILQQIKSLHESTLAMQQQNFTKLFSILEEQLNCQRTLNTMIADFALKSSSQSSSGSKNGHKT